MDIHLRHYFSENARCTPSPAKAAAKLRRSLVCTGADGNGDNHAGAGNKYDAERGKEEFDADHDTGPLIVVGAE